MASSPVQSPSVVRVLVVDDDADYVRFLELLFAQAANPSLASTTVHRLGDLQPAIERDQPDAILLDLSLPDGHGIDWLRNRRASAPPVIVLTGADGDEVTREALSAGAVDVLVKGRLDPDQLVRALRYALERARGLEALRTRDEQLRQWQKIEAVGRLAGGIAHDFSNILTVIVGAAERLQDALPPDRPPYDDVQTILRNCARATSLTRQLLAFSRRQVLAPRPVDLAQLVEASASHLLKHVIGEDIDLVVDTASLPCRVKADPVQMEQVLLNLAVNARDAMPSGGTLRLRVRVEMIDRAFATGHAPMQPGEYVLLEVSDTGHGMDVATAARAFEPFFTTKDPGRGTGLGLATVYGIVKQSDGFIWIDSAPGRGATFRIYLPRTHAQATPPASHAPHADSPRGLETILLTEDQEDVRDLVSDVLTSHGYTVLQAHGPADALARANAFEGTIDLLLTDVVMPGGTGRDLARQLQQVRPALKVLFISGYPEHSSAPGAVLEPGAPFLAKPFTRAVLLRKLRDVLD